MIYILFWIMIGIATFFFEWKNMDESMEEGIGSYNHISLHERRMTLKLFLIACMIIGPVMTAWCIGDQIHKKIRKET
jgi:hypothetical protein